MHLEKGTLNYKKTEADFRRLIQGILADRLPADALLENPIFTNRLRLITMAQARTAQDAEELANDVRLKVWRNIKKFRPTDREPYDGFFSWLRAVTRHAHLDSRRKDNVEFEERPVEDLKIADTQTDIESSFLYKEVMTEFKKSINALPPRERLAIAYYLQGLTYRETSEKVRQAGFSSSHAAVAKWIEDGLSAFLPKADELPTIRSKNPRLTKVRATRAKREFYSVIEQAINSGTAAIKSQDIYNLLGVVKPEPSKTTKSTSRPGWQSASDLLKSMQSPEAKKGIQAAFDASPAALGQAAVEHATQGRKVPAGSLTTLLMATSTANVVGRVMNLTKDVA